VTAGVLPERSEPRPPKSNRWAGTLGFLGWRLLYALGVIAGVVVITFLLLHLIPGDPAQSMLGNRATPAAVASLRAQWGLDRPLWTQFGSFVARLFTRGDTGRSLFYQVPARDLIFPRIGVTLELIVMAGLFCVVITVPLAVWAAVRKDRLADQVIRIIPSIGAGLPALWVGLLLIVLFGVHLRWFPVGGAGPGPWLTFRGLILPAFTAAIAIVPVLIRSLRAGLLEVLESDYIAAARAKSLGEGRVMLAHAARNAAVPTLTLLGLNLAYLVGGTVVVERVFAIDGLGNLLFDSISNRDFPVVQGIALFFAVVVVGVNLLTDLACAAVDPRLRITRRRVRR
jgi:peptide/nickel transport system permease protein